MPGRKYTAGTGYRYGFNGKENDNDVKGEGNQQDYGERIYDPRIGKFLSVDPITAKYPELTPYQFASNRPIDGIDIDGLEWGIYSYKAFQNNGQTYVKVHTEAYSNTWLDRIGGAQYWLRSEGSASGDQGIAFDSYNEMFNAAKRFAGGQVDYKVAKKAFDQKSWETFKALVVTDLALNAHDAVNGFVNNKLAVKNTPAVIATSAVNNTKILATEGRTTTIIGRLDDVKAATTGLENVKSGLNNGGFNILNQPPNYYSLSGNTKWLQRAINRNDIIKPASDPLNLNNIWKDGIVGGKRTSFGEEVKLLEQNKFKYDAKKQVFVK